MGDGPDAAITLDGRVLSRTPSIALENRVSEIFVALRDPVYRYLLAILNSASLAEELTQEAFIRLLKELRSGRPVGNVRSWVFRVAHNLAIDQIRERQAPDACVPLDQSDCLAVLEDPAADLEAWALDRETMARVQAALAKLPPLERQCLELRAEGLKYREIAEVLATHIPNVQVLLARAIRRIAKEIHA